MADRRNPFGEKSCGSVVRYHSKDTIRFQVPGISWDLTLLDKNGFSANLVAFDTRIGNCEAGLYKCRVLLREVRFVPVSSCGLLL